MTDFKMYFNRLLFPVTTRLKRYFLTVFFWGTFYQLNFFRPANGNSWRVLVKQPTFTFKRKF